MLKKLNSLRQVVAYEIKEQNTTQEQISYKLNKNNGNFWRVFYKGNTKYSLLLKLLQILGFEVILRHKKSGKEYTVKRP